MPKVLIVDDIADNVKLLNYCLSGQGFELISASTGREALDAAEREHPDTILLDVMMPVMDGIEVCRTLRENEATAQIPVILVTAMAEEADVLRGLDAGADDYVTKPYNGRIIAARTRAAVQRYTAIRENQRLISELRTAAATDPLTGLLNRRTLFDLAEHDLRRSLRDGERLACVMIDIDHFKSINDTFGHLAGDQALRQVAETLQAGCRDSDLVGRYGGEEFCVVLPSTNAEGGENWADRRRRDVEETRVRWDEQWIQLTASFGVAQADKGESSIAELINRADLALLQAKTNGRNQVIVASGEFVG